MENKNITFLLYVFKKIIYAKMGCSQVVRQWTLTPSSVGSNPPTPDSKKPFILYIEVGR